jgi:hypothetical protein
MMELEWLADLLLLPAGCGWDNQKEALSADVHWPIPEL